MATQAYSKGIGVSVKKMRLIIDLVRGKGVDEALELLRFVASPSTEAVVKTIKSAAANAENNDLLDRENLRIVSITADAGPVVRRYRPKARGRAGAFNRHTCHLTVVVDEAAEAPGG